ncbi:hypothetical protein CVT26_015025 [Gymnopilus dilepis]|uniref:Nephrocystin 3-like N-terminal domain-containing protein n=1 Tax=Gymnopilus dilepis TaxID=231916 RepID=A0A409YNS0_9AGAR|nr:hypothetical protein CVT26_015025 [Gymnopilus dilepis]
MADDESHSRLQDTNRKNLLTVVKPIKRLFRTSKPASSSLTDAESSSGLLQKLLKPKAKHDESKPTDKTGTIGALTTTENAAELTARSSTKDNLLVTLRFLRTLAKNSAQIVDNNPAKIALGLVKLVIDISRTLQDNKDTVARQIASTGAKLKELEMALEDWNPRDKEATPWMDDFRTTLTNELHGLEILSDESNLRKVLDHEDEQTRIKDIFVRIDEARVRFELALGIRVFKATYEINRDIRTVILKHLEPSDIAHHDYILEGTEGQLLRRQVCTPGTRVHILDDIITWAKDTSSDSPTVYWLFGHAGSGKSTIAYTIARRFEFAGDPTDTIILGGNFMCSRLFERTRLSKYIIRTIVYHLALKCKPFADALIRSGRLETITHNLRTQLDGLLFGPWLESKDARHADPSMPQRYLVVIDALDEIDGNGGSDFLRDLVNTINKSSKECLSGLKFFITSRSDPGLVVHVESLERKQLYRLQDVEEGEARADVRTYLNASLSFLKGREEMDQLAGRAGGLFIYAATVVKLLKSLPPLDQKKTLRKLFSSNDANPSRSSFQSPETLLNKLYSEILISALGGLEEEQLRDRLWMLFTLICAREPLSVTTVTRLLFEEDPEETDPEFSYTKIVSNLLDRLHSVLYFEHELVFTYHKSFSDFIFDRERSGQFWCNGTEHHRLLAACCFNVMGRLKFNMANIPTSFILDEDNPTLANGIEQNISSGLSYGCRNWDYHISAVQSIPSDTLFGILSDFLQIRVLFWIEAMNLLDLCGRCYPMLRAVYYWVSKSNASLPADSRDGCILTSSQENSALAKNLAEAASFALYFSGSRASASTPHLYISALATWHGKADVCQAWKSHFPRLPAFVNAGTGGTLMAINVGSGVNAVAFSPDSGCIVSGSDDGLIQIWDASTGKMMHSLEGHTFSVSSVAFSSDGSQIVSGSWDRSIRIWDASTSEEICVLKGHTDCVNSVAFSSDGSRIASGSDDNSARIWDASTGKQIRVLNGHSDNVSSVAFSSDCKHIVSGSKDKSIRVWDVSTGKEVHVLEGCGGEVNSVAASCDGRFICGSDERSISIWDSSTGMEIRILQGHTSFVHSVKFSSDGSRIVSGSWDNSIRIWDASTGKEIRVLEGHTNEINSVAFSSDGSHIASGSYDNSIRIWDASLAGEIGVQEDGISGVHSVALSNDGSHIVSDSKDGSICIWDALTGARIHTLQGHTSDINSVAFSSEGDRIVSGSSDRSIRVWDSSTGAQILVLGGLKYHVYSVDFSSDGRRIVSGSGDNSIHIWDASTGKEIRVLQCHTDAVTSVAFSTKGDRIVSGSWDHSIRIWDASTGVQIHVLEGHTAPIRSVSFSDDGTRIVSGCDDKSPRIWDASTGKVIHVLEGHTNCVGSVAFSSDGSRIISSSWDRSIRIWDASTGAQIHVLEGHADWVRSVTISSDGTRIVSGCDDNSIRIWDVSAPCRGARYIREKVDNSLYGEDAIYTGWLRSEKGYLMFVPSEKNLPDDANILTIPYSHVPHVDFTNAALGPEWAQCYSDKST